MLTWWNLLRLRLAGTEGKRIAARRLFDDHLTAGPRAIREAFLRELNVQGPGRKRLYEDLVLYLGLWKEERAIERIASFLGESYDVLRLRAARTLARPFHDERAFAPLSDFLVTDESQDVRLGAAEALAELGGEQATDRILETLADENWELRYPLYKVLDGLDSEWPTREKAKALTPRLIEELQTMGDNEQRYEILKRMARIRDRRAIRPILEFCLDNGRAISWSGRGGFRVVFIDKVLDQLEPEWRETGEAHCLTDRLVAVLKRERGAGEHNTEVENAIWLAGQIGAAELLRHLLRFLCSERCGERQEAARALGHAGNTEAVPSLVDRLNDEHLNVREAAATALGQIGDKRAIEPLLVRLRDPGSEGQERRALVRSLGRFDAPQVVDLLIGCLSQEHEHDLSTRKTAVKGLTRSKQKRALAPLTGALDDSSNPVRYATADALITFGADAVPFIDQRYDSLSPNGKEAALYALGEIGASNGVPVAIRGLEGPGWEVRVVAAAALRKLRDPRSAGPLRRALDDSTWNVTGEAALALAEIDADWAGLPEARKAISSLVCGLVSGSESAREGSEALLNQIDPNWPHSKGAHRALAYLREKAVSGDKKPVRLAAISALVQMRDPERADVFVSALSVETDAEIREALKQALVQIGGRFKALAKLR